MRFDQYSIEIFDATYTSVWQLGPLTGSGEATFSHLVGGDISGRYVRVSQNNDDYMNLKERGGMRIDMILLDQQLQQ